MGADSVVRAVMSALNFIMREAALFSAAGFLVLGLSDLAVDLVWIVRTSWNALVGRKSRQFLRMANLPPPAEPGLLAIFTPAWDEAAVIGPMLRHTLRTLDHPNYRIYVGCYPNDLTTIVEAEGVGDPRVRVVVGPRPGPTTKADCLNRLWERMLVDEVDESRLVKAVVLHDAEDVVDRVELRLFDSLTDQYDLVQVPVLPMVHRHSRWVSGHYADEFAESHAKDLLVRGWLGAALPSVGVGWPFRERL